jgi:hypothetical protein
MGRAVSVPIRGERGRGREQLRPAGRQSTRAVAPAGKPAGKPEAMFYYLLVCGHWAEWDGHTIRGANDYMYCDQVSGGQGHGHQRVLIVTAESA